MGSREQHAVSEKVRNLEDAASPNAIGLAPEGRVLKNVPLRDKNAMDEQFRTSAYTTSDKQDELMTAKLQLQEDEQPGVTKFGVMQAKDSDFEWLRKKREQAEYANFSAWFAENFDKMDPAQKKLAREMFPSFYQERQAQLGKDIELQGRLARIKLMGVQNKDDLLLQYAAEAGYIAAEPLEHILHPERAHLARELEERKLRFGRGLLNPRRLVTGDYKQQRKFNSNTLSSHQENQDNWKRGQAGSGIGFASYKGPLQRNAGPKAQHDYLSDFL